VVGVSAPGTREVAHRLFAAEFEDADFSYSESDEERAPNYVVSPTGARINRLFVAGVLTEVSQAGESILRARVVDPTGAFVVYAGQYQPEAMTFLDRTTPPAFVAVTGKARTFQPEDSDRVYTSVRPESVNEVDGDTRDRWTVSAAERTLERIGVVAAALDTGLTGDALREALAASGVDESLAAGVPIALDRYGTTRAYLAALQEVALEAVRLVTGDVDEVGDLDLAPDEGGDVGFSPAIPTRIDAEAVEAAEGDGVAEPGEPAEPAESEAADAEGEADRPAEAANATVEGSAAEAETETGTETGLSEGETEVSATDATPEAGFETPAPEAESESSAGERGPTDEAVDSEDEAAVDADTDPTSDIAAEPEPGGESEGEGADPDASEEPTEAPASEPADTTATAEPPEPSDEPPGTAATEADGTVPEADEEAAEPEEFDIDEETRREVEEEFGTDFSTGNEVAPAGEADIETPEPEAESAPEDRPASGASGEVDPEATDVESPTDTTDAEEPSFEAVDPDDVADEEPSTESSGPAREPPAAEPDEPPAAAPDEEDEAGGGGSSEEGEDVDLETALLDTMRDLDDGDGADREALVAQVRDETGASADDVADAIQDALMSGQCYEPEDGRLKPI
jgi:hypothetical protein